MIAGISIFIMATILSVILGLGLTLAFVWARHY